MRRTIPILALGAALAFAGCRDPYRSDHAPRAAAQTVTAPPPATDNARPGPQAGRIPDVTVRREATPRRAARAFAVDWANWDWRTAASRQRALARLATGDLRAQLRANASSARIDASLGRDRPGSRGHVAAISLRAHGANASGIVVTHEQTYTNGRSDLGGRRYRVYVIRMKRERQGWGVSGWQPQP
jgi:hypothetical protein